MKKFISVSLVSLGLTASVLCLSGNVFGAGSKSAPRSAVAQKQSQLKVRYQAGSLASYQPTLDWLRQVHPAYASYTLERVRDMTSLSLQLYSIETAALINDSAMAHVGRLKNLESLRVHRAIGDGGFAHFAGLTKLKLINAPTCRLTTSGMIHLKNLSNLNNLVIAGTNVGEEGMDSIANKGNL